MNDSETIRSVLRGNRDDFRILVEKYQQRVFRLAMGFVHDREDAEDLTQEIFLNAWLSLAKFRGSSSFSTWLHRIAVNACLNHTRKNKGTILDRISSFLGTEAVLTSEIPLTEDNPEEIIVNKEHQEWVQRALGSLPENQRSAIVLSKYEDLPQKEIAEILNITEGAVEALIQRAKKNLREKLLSASKGSEYKRRKN
jgi:RNA polymerase sigma-70 factor (ECF subfamily)